MNRIIVVGTSGSGKTTLARAIASKMGIKHIEMDALQHLADWQPNPNFTAELLLAAQSAERWVADGNYGSRFNTYDTFWPLADTVVWLDYSRAVCMRRVTVRTIKRTLLREKLWNGNRERLSNLWFSNKYSMIRWTWQTHARRRAKYTEMIAADRWQYLNWIRFTQPSESSRWLDSLH